MSIKFFQDFLSLFPPAKLPVSITLDSYKTFEQVNDLIPIDLASEFIIQEDELPEEEFTEFLPCFQITSRADQEFISLVYWKAALMRYDYILATYTKSGIPISRQVIAGTSSDGKSINQKVATIETDGDVQVIQSTQDASDMRFDPSQTKEIYYELAPSGHISQLNENE
jgi:hypothetical protein